tara:strand:+ start:10361 stop:10693 length:333 start_codon:yes stop_codon:yes gene_type:complete
MYISLEALQKLNFVDKAIIHSHDQSLYLLSVEIDGKEYFVKTSKDNFLKSFSIANILSQFPITKIGEVWLRQKTPYDEMIGLSASVDNTLEVKIGGVFYSEEMHKSDSIH